jgi:hypothetical protein
VTFYILAEVVLILYEGIAISWRLSLISSKVVRRMSGYQAKILLRMWNGLSAYTKRHVFPAYLFLSKAHQSLDWTWKSSSVYVHSLSPEAST